MNKTNHIFLCEYCKLNIDDEDDFIDHFKTDEHKEIIRKSFGYDRPGAKFHIYSCKKCDYVCNKSENIRDHIKSMHEGSAWTSSYTHIKPNGLKVYTCNHCNTSSDLYSFNKHLACITHQYKINTGCHLYTYENDYKTLCWTFH